MNQQVENKNEKNLQYLHQYEKYVVKNFFIDD